MEYPGAGDAYPRGGGAGRRAGARHGGADDPRASSAMTARTFGRRGESYGGAGDQVVADGVKKEAANFRGKVSGPKRTHRSIGGEVTTRIDLVKDIGRGTLGKRDIELSMLSHEQG